MEKYCYKSPVGTLEITVENNKLTALKMSDKIFKNNIKSDIMKNIVKQLDDYFASIRKKFDIEISFTGSGFQKRVWKKLLKIPYGAVRSYSDIAKEIGSPNASRAVGSACNKNPILIIVPCHRVISKNGSIGGFACGNSIKQKLLDIEKNV